MLCQNARVGQSSTAENSDLQTNCRNYRSWIQHTHTRLTALFLGLPMWAGTRKVKPIGLLLNQEIVSGSDISWAVCTLLQTDNHASTPPATTQFFTGRMPFLPPNQQRHSTECNALKALKFNATVKLHTKSVSMIWYWQCCCCKQ